MAKNKENKDRNEKGQFTFGNSYSQKKWATPEELQKDIDAYFEWCKKNPIENVHNSQIDKNTNLPLVYYTKRPYTIEGLCLALDCDRDTLLNYQKEQGYEPYFGTIKKAKLKIQQDKVERGLNGNSVASVTIFDLKNNHGYKDRQEIDQTTTSRDMSEEEEKEYKSFLENKYK